jgi:hypothetical protein
MATKKAPAKKTPVKKAAKSAAPVGRPSAYKPEYAEQAYKLCLLGATDKKLADFFGVSESTLNLWKQEYPQFSESMAAGKDQADAEIAQALFHRAKGYSHPEVDIRVVASEIVQTPLVKHYPPDTQAASLWLRNRQPAVWRDKVDMEHSGPNGGPIEQSLTVEFVGVKR